MAEEKTVDAAPLLTSKGLAGFVATVPSEKFIDEFIDDIATHMPDALPVVVARATPIRKALQYIERTAEARITIGRIILFGKEWVDPENGVLYEFSGERSDRRVPDAAGLRDALLKAGAPKDMVHRAIYDTPKVNFTELNNLTHMDRKYAEIVDDFEAERGYGPAHLKEKK
jgi:hypothetical protein